MHPEQIANLRHNFSRCVLIICGTLDSARLASVLTSYGNPFGGIKIGTWAVYLGFPIGSVVPGFLERTCQTRQLGLGVAR
eukprot:7459129-Pyramimonas_sp.AAC.1